MVEGRIDEAAMAMEGQVIAGDPGASWSGAALDSRRVTGGELFFALPGERTDGHRFVGDALARGAAAAVVDREGDWAGPPGALIRVPDSLTALHALTRAVRRRVPERLIAVTGSAGKTTTKELLTAMLGRRFRAACNPGNLNNLYGFPIALLGLADDTEWMVAEMGMSTPGELRRIAALGRPDVALFTNVRPVHLEFFGSLRRIADAKAELLEALGPEGLVVANADDQEVARFARRHPGRIVWYGIESRAEYRARDIEPRGAGESGTRFELVRGDRRRTLELPLHGLYNVANCVAAAACAAELGVSFDEIAEALRQVRDLPGRGVVHRLASGATVIDDSYNSNPAALSLALESARGLPATRRWAVLGDMLELGPAAEQLHHAAGAEAARLGFSPVHGVGPLALALVEGASEAGAETAWHADAEAAAAALRGAVAAGDLVLVKGSRGVALEKVVRALLGERGGG